VSHRLPAAGAASKGRTGLSDGVRIRAGETGILPSGRRQGEATPLPTRERTPHHTPLGQSETIRAQARDKEEYCSLAAKASPCPCVAPRRALHVESINHSWSDDGIWLSELNRTHPGVTPSWAPALCEAAAVALSRHHAPPKAFRIIADGEPSEIRFRWTPPVPSQISGNANELDTTMHGAYAISLRSVEFRMGLVAIGRAEACSGADWYVAPPGAGLDENGLPDLDDPRVRRLEVSGQDKGTLGHRTHVKEQQLRLGRSSIPGIAAVVGFEIAMVRLEHVATQGAEQ